MSARALAVAVIFGAPMLLGCEEWKQQQQPDPRATENPDKFVRDREICRTQVDEYMRQRRNIEDVSRGAEDIPETVGQRGLSTQMSNYSDSRSADKAMASCMEGRGWPQPQPPWWQRIGS